MKKKKAVPTAAFDQQFLLRDESIVADKLEAVKEEEEEVVKKVAHSAPPPAQMREIIMKQKASGCWDWADAVALVRLPADKLRAGIPKTRLQSGTLLRRASSRRARVLIILDHS